MTVDQQIREGLAVEPLGPPPTEEDRAAVHHAAMGLRRRRAVARGSVSAVAAIALVVLAAVVRPSATREVSTGPSGSPTSVGAGQLPEGWVTTVEPTLSWTMAHPAEWTVTSVASRCGIDARTIVSSAGPPPTEGEPVAGCANELDWRAVPRHAVLVSLTRRSETANVPEPSDPAPDSTFPLVVPPDEQFVGASDGFRAAALRVRYGGDDRYQVVVWFGDDASDQAKADARRVVELLRPPADVPPTTATASAGATRTVPLPRVDPLGGGEDALAAGVVHLDGACLVIGEPGRGGKALVFSASDAYAVVGSGGELLDVVVDGRSIGPLDRALELPGGYHDPRTSARQPFHDLPASCASDEVFITW